MFSQCPGRGAAAALLASAALWSPAASAEAPDVVVSIKPIHSLVAAVMDGVAEPRLLVEGGASPHTYSLRPSDAHALSEADVVFWVGDVLETFLVGPLGALAADARTVQVIDASGLTLHRTRAGGAWETHVHAPGDHADHDHEEEGHDSHGRIDGHVWLDPDNARKIVELTATALSEQDPANAPTYRDNAAAAVRRLTTLEADLRSRLAPVRNVPYVVFHDAYQYLEAAFDLNAVGSITISPEIRPGARRLVEIRAKIQDLHAACVFSEPQFEPQLVDTIAEGLAVRRGVLDPMGFDLEPGVALYPTLMYGLVDSLTACLGGG